MVQGQAFLKGGWAGTSPIYFFQGLSFFKFRNYYTLCKIVLCIQRSYKLI